MLPPEAIANNRPGFFERLGQIFSQEGRQKLALERDEDEYSQLETSVLRFLHTLTPFGAQIEQLKPEQVTDLKIIVKDTCSPTRVYATKDESGYTVTLDERISALVPYATGLFLGQATYNPGFDFNPDFPATGFEHTIIKIHVGNDIRVKKGQKYSYGNGEGNPGWIKDGLTEATEPVTDRKTITSILKHTADILTPTPD